MSPGGSWGGDEVRAGTPDLPRQLGEQHLGAQLEPDSEVPERKRRGIQTATIEPRRLPAVGRIRQVHLAPVAPIAVRPRPREALIEPPTGVLDRPRAKDDLRVELAESRDHRVVVAEDLLPGARIERSTREEHPVDEGHLREHEDVGRGGSEMARQPGPGRLPALGIIGQLAHCETHRRQESAAARSSRMALAGSCASNTAEPATRIEAPCSASGRACSIFTPPSMETSTPRAPSIVRMYRIFGYTAGTNVWPPKPGFTDITRTRSRSSLTHSIVSGGVAGFRAAPAFTGVPRLAVSSRIEPSVRCRCGHASTCTVSMSAPRAANSARYFSGSTIIRCRSSGRRVRLRIASRIGKPSVMLGTKRPSITSMWI